MSRYIQHLQELSNQKTSRRKKDYIDFNLKEYFKDLDLKSIKVLEVGPGMGEFEDYLNEREIVDIDIVDNDSSILNYVFKKNKIRKKYLTKDILLIANNLRNYNFIFLMQVLEHIPKDKYHKVIKLLYAHLEKGGYLIIVVPNANNPLGLIERYGDLQHTGSFTEQSLKDLTSLSGIKNYEMEIRGYEIPPYDPLNILRIVLQKILHAILLGLMVINGGIYFKTMTPNIMLAIRKKL